MSEYTPGTYVKGESVRVANSASEAVALRFEGYKLQDESAPVDEATEPDKTAQPDAVAPGTAVRPRRPSDLLSSNDKDAPTS